MKVCRRATFNAAHRLFNPAWTDEKNNQIFGKCSYPNYHGHNYVLEVWVEGEINQETGFVINLKSLKEIIKSQITDKFDHRNLNLDCAEFKTIIPTAENIALVCWNQIRPCLPNHLGLSIKLWETENNIVEYAGPTTN